MMPEPRRMAIHQAGHAVVQTLVGRGRFIVAEVSLHGPHGGTWRGRPARGEALLDREAMLGLYEFGLVTLAGIAAENRYLENQAPEAEPLVALSDLAEWQERAWETLENENRIGLVSLNVMRRLDQWLANGVIWSVVEELAEALLAEETLRGLALQKLLEPLTAGAGEVLAG